MTGKEEKKKKKRGSALVAWPQVSAERGKITVTRRNIKMASFQITRKKIIKKEKKSFEIKILSINKHKRRKREREGKRSISDASSQ